MVLMIYTFYEFQCLYLLFLEVITVSVVRIRGLQFTFDQIISGAFWYCLFYKENSPFNQKYKAIIL
jgi:hypothetical protein